MACQPKEQSVTAALTGKKKTEKNFTMRKGSFDNLLLFEAT